MEAVKVSKKKTRLQLDLLEKFYAGEFSGVFCFNLFDFL